MTITEEEKSSGDRNTQKISYLFKNTTCDKRWSEKWRTKPRLQQMTLDIGKMHMTSRLAEQIRLQSVMEVDQRYDGGQDSKLHTTSRPTGDR